MLMEVDSTNQGQTPTLEWLVTAVGDEALAYLFGRDSPDIPRLVSGEVQPSNIQTQIIERFSQLRRNMPSELDDDSINEYVRVWLMQVGQGRTLASQIRESVFGQEDSPDTNGELERALATLALDVYAGFLFPPDPRIPFMPQLTSIHVTRAAFHHPASTAFQESILKDPRAAAIFATEIEHSGRTCMMLDNTGSGSSLQLVMLADLLLNRAWRRLGSQPQSPTALARQSVEELRLVRDLMAGKTHNIPAKIAFTGVLLPGSAQLTLDCGVVRSATEEDRKLAPESLKGQLSGTDSDGVRTLINYDGDIVLEYDYPFKVRFFEPEGFDFSKPFPDDLRAPNLTSAVTRLRFSLMLAVDRPSRVQLIQTWQSIDTPLSTGPSMAWSDPRQGTGLMPTQLTEAEVAAWGDWYQRLSTPHVARIELALSRVLRAIAERREPSDVLIDSVIAWENLFGTKEGEPTFRISTCLAILLEESLDARQRLKKRLTDIYGLRSKIVHGSRNLKPNEYPMCQEALDIAIRAIRILSDDRSDILELPDGAQRSARLLLGG